MFTPLWIYSSHYYQPLNTCPVNIVLDLSRCLQSPCCPLLPVFHLEFSSFCPHLAKSQTFFQTVFHDVIAAAAAAKSLQPCPTLCDPIDGSSPGSPVPWILQARTLEWVAISFSSAWKWKVKAKSLSPVWLIVTPWTAASQAPLSMGFARQEYWSGVPLPSPDVIVYLIVISTLSFSHMSTWLGVRRYVCYFWFLWQQSFFKASVYNVWNESVGLVDDIFIFWIYYIWIVMHYMNQTICCVF